MMDWLPIPQDFRSLLRQAVESPANRVEALAALAQYRLNFLETAQLDRALGPLCAESHAGFSDARLAVLASSTVDHLAGAMRVAGLRRRLLIDVHICPY